MLFFTWDHLTAVRICHTRIIELNRQLLIHTDSYFLLSSKYTYIAFGVGGVATNIDVALTLKNK